MNEAARSGECQICGATQKLDTAGRLVRHGHRAAGPGIGGGSCHGTGFAPYRTATDALEDLIGRLRAAQAARPAPRTRLAIQRLERRLEAGRPQALIAPTSDRRIR